MRAARRDALVKEFIEKLKDKHEASKGLSDKHDTIPEEEHISDDKKS